MPSSCKGGQSQMQSNSLYSSVFKRVWLKVYTIAVSHTVKR